MKVVPRTAGPASETLHKLGPSRSARASSVGGTVDAQKAIERHIRKNGGDQLDRLS